MSKNKEKEKSTKKSSAVVVMTRDKADEIIEKNRKKNGKVRLAKKVHRRVCDHNRLTKKGKYKPNIVSDGNGLCRCKDCGAVIPTKILTKDESRQLRDDTMQYIDQGKYLSRAANLGENAQDYFVNLAVNFGKFNKVYNKTAKVVTKRDSVKNKKNKNKQSRSGSSNLGGWS